jgi:hypothetical protein
MYHEIIITYQQLFFHTNILLIFTCDPAIQETGLIRMNCQINRNSQV